MARIVRFHQYGDPSVLNIEDLDVPSPAADEVQYLLPHRDQRFF
jgi:NADPH:quinone reductase-like Zn-dependent oxidoreductase